MSRGQPQWRTCFVERDPQMPLARRAAAAGVGTFLLMLVASGAVSKFIEENPTVKMLGLSFLLLIGVALLADAAHFHIPRGYLYFAVAFSAVVEAFNQFATRNKKKKKKK